MQTSGITRLVTVDLHAGQIQGFFDVPVDHLYGASILAKYINEKNLEECYCSITRSWRCYKSS